MKKLLLVLLSLSLNLGFAQNIQGIVIDSDNGSPLPFVNITINGTKVGAATDIDGKFSFPYKVEQIKFLDISYIGFEKKRVTEISENMTIKLKEQTSELDEVTVLPGENPAHRIIKNAVKNRKLNNPEKIPSFSYKTYSKFVASLDVDSLDVSIDTLQIHEKDTAYTRLDSSNYRLSNYIDDHHLFFMESVTERKFLAPSRDNETVLASRTSGFKNPMFSLFITQMQSFSFYNDYITILGDEYLNPVTPGSTSRYFFIIEDTTYNASNDTVFIISFRPRPNYGFQPLEGLLYINSTNWAIQNVLAHPHEKEAIQITIEQQYKKVGDHTWFPAQLNAELEFDVISVNNVKPYGKMRTYIKDIEINKEFKKRDISRADMTIDNDAVKNADTLLSQYRVNPISEKEANTYHTMDSIGKAENLDMKLKLLTTLMRGSIPVYFVDIGLDRIIRINDYEGVRLGGSAYTNDRFSKWFKVGGFIGYGFKDEDFKYGWDAEITLDKYSDLKLFGGWQYDIFESGAPSLTQEPRLGVLNDSYRILKIRQWDKTTQYWGGISYDIIPQLHTQLRFQRENRLMSGSYFYRWDGGENPVWQNGFNFTELVASVKYTPNEKFIEGPDFGKLTYSKQYPVFYAQYTRGMSDVLNSDFEYDKVDVKLEHQIKTVRIGTITFSAQAGTVLSDVPYSKLYTGKANRNLIEGLRQFTLIADRNSFETMLMNEFLMDQYVHLFYRQDFKSLFFRRENFAPHIEFVSRAAWGSLRSPELHQNISVQSLDKGYYESGIEINKLIEQNFFGIGLGFYYRYGPYQLPDANENFTLKITSKFAF